MSEQPRVDCASRYDRVPRGIARYGYGDWDRALGNHRAVIRVTATTDVAYAWLPWRRRDAFPQAKHVMVVDAQTGKSVANSVVATCNREYGEVVFEPTSGPGLYYAYYLMPTPDRHRWIWPRSSFPTTMYEPPRTTASAAWMAAHHVTHEDTGSTPDPRQVAWVSNESVPAPWRDLPEADLVEFQSRGEWHSFYPMEACATLEERLGVIQRSGAKDFVLFPEKQTQPIRMNKDIPYHWGIRERAELYRFEDTARRHEYFTFQVAVFAHSRILPNIAATWTALRTPQGAEIPATALTCFNLSGVDQTGRPFTKTVHVGFQEVQALWFGVDIPENALPGLYEGDVTIAAQDAEPQTIHLCITVEDTVLADRGDGDFQRMSRLRWLNSAHAQDNDVCPPYTPVRTTGRVVKILGRTLELDESGLPAQLTSFIDMFRIRKAGRDILTAPVRCDAIEGGTCLPWHTVRPARCARKASGKVQFRATQSATGLTRSIETAVEMDGRVSIRMTFQAVETRDLDSLRLSLRLPADVTRYWLEAAPPSWVASRSRLATACPDSTEKPLAEFQFAWLGDYNAGLTLSIARGQAAWLGGRDGTFRQQRQNGTCEVEINTGALTLTAGEPLTLEFALYVTPFKPLATEHWDWRYYHQGYGQDMDVARGIAAGAKIFTQHQGSPKCPYINNLFPVTETLKAMADEVHQVGGRFKAYNTIREQSTRTAELWPCAAWDTRSCWPAPAISGSSPWRSGRSSTNSATRSRNRSPASSGCASTWWTIITPAGTAPSRRQTAR